MDSHIGFLLKDEKDSRESGSRKAQIFAESDRVFLVWSAEDAKTLRSKWRIIGSFVGAHPKFVNQNEQLGLPLQLMPEEVYVLLKENVVDLCRLKNNRIIPSVGDRLQYQEVNDMFVNEYKTAVAESRIDSVTREKAELAAKGRKAKQHRREKLTGKSPKSRDLHPTKKELEETNVTAEEIKAVLDEMLVQSSGSDEDILFETCSQSPIHCSKDYESLKLKEPSCARENLRRVVFHDLWKKGNFLTSGLKFGCDFLVYPGDPLRYHSSKMVFCVEEPDCINATQLSSWSRVATNVKKSVLLCFLNAHQRVDYLTVNWEKTAG